MRLQNSDLATVVTATVGDSWEHLLCSMTELRKFTNVPFRQIVSDDGTLSEQAKFHQRSIVADFADARWTENPGPVYGIGHNLNHLFSLIETPWAFVIEDAVRPGWGWLETALDALEKIGLRPWRGRQVGAIGGSSSFDHWELEVANILPSHLGFHAYFGKCSHETMRAFWQPHWNDGLLCWPRLLPAIREACGSLEADSWPQLVQESWRTPILLDTFFDRPANDWHGPHVSCWPRKRHAWPALAPAAWSLINMEAWRNAGGWREGCCFYEGHLGMRLSRRGWLSVSIDNPPWLHYPSIAFSAVRFGMAKEPRHLEKDLGADGIFQKDFGCQTHEEMAVFCERCYDPQTRGFLKGDLEEVEIYMDPRWRAWC